jgi:hypothetical protein
LDHGHPKARHYPLGYLMDEVSIVVRRVNNGHITDATLLQGAVSGVLSKKANKEFHKQIARLQER